MERMENLVDPTTQKQTEIKIYKQETKVCLFEFH
jgi:hypothetical protein